MIQDQTSNTLSWSPDRTLPSLVLSSSLSSQSTSGPSSTRSRQARRDSRPQLQASSSSPTPSTPPTTYPPSSDASSSTDSFKTADSLPSPAAPSPASTTISHASTSPESQSPSQADPPSGRNNLLGSSLNLNKPLPILPPPSRPPSSYGYGPFVAETAPPPPAYTPFDPHALLFHISFPYIYASSNDASSAPTPRYQVSLSHTRAGRPHQLALRRLTRSESRRVAFASDGSSTSPTASTSALVPFDNDLTLYTATYYSPRAAVPEIRGCKASTVAGRLVPSPASPFALAAGRSWKGRGASWELCRLTREKTDGGGERDGRWEFREKEAWRRDVVFAATERMEKEKKKGVSGGGREQEEEYRRVRRKGSLGMSLRRGLGMATAPATTTTMRIAAAGEQHCRYDSNEDAIEDAEEPSQTRRHHHGIFEWRAGTVSLSSPSPPSPSQSSTMATTPVAPSQLVATSGAITTTKTIPINFPVHAATAPPATSANEPRSAGIDADVEAQGSSRRRAGTTSTATMTGTRMGMGMMRRRPSSTALALRRVASRVSLRTTDNIVDDTATDPDAPSSTPFMKRERERGRQRKMHQTSTRRWLRLERPLERRALDALVMAWVVSAWMDMDGQGPGLGEDGSD
ncbi:uncharacterized protein J3D65DRAFT_260645 [Phyllosticta citribraziliensis]|uniref:Uncharacterized protein n=1 Tax=Phyllosticta citribraziliensis TaxID=989973 RepID=A0ABR1M0D8_9PEZI